MNGVSLGFIGATTRTVKAFTCFRQGLHDTNVVAANPPMDA